MSSVQILATIQSLESQLAMLKSMVQGSAAAPAPAVEAKPKKVKASEAKAEEPKEKKPMSEGVRLWNVLIAETLEQMKASGWKHPESGKPATRKDAMAAASANKKAAAPPSPPKAGKASSVASAEESGAESDDSKGKKGPKKGSHWSPETKAAAAAKRAAKKIAVVPLPESDSEEDEMVKVIITGHTYFINSKTNAAYRDGTYEGIFDGSKINTEAAEPM